MDHGNLVTALIKELLILKRTVRAAVLGPLSAEQLEEWKYKRKRIRQEIVQALSLEKLQREMLVVQNYIEQ